MTKRHIKHLFQGFPQDSRWKAIFFIAIINFDLKANLNKEKSGTGEQKGIYRRQMKNTSGKGGQKCALTRHR